MRDKNKLLDELQNFEFWRKWVRGQQRLRWDLLYLPRPSQNEKQFFLIVGRVYGAIRREAKKRLGVQEESEGDRILLNKIAADMMSKFCQESWEWRERRKAQKENRQ